MPQIEVSSRTLHHPPGAPAMPTVTLDFLQQEIAVEELIRRTVEEQIRELTAKRKLDMDQAQRTLNAQYLEHLESAKERSEEHGEHASANAELLPPQASRVSTSISAGRTRSEVRKAIEGFQKRLYRIIIDGRLVERLDEKIVFEPGSKVTFIRLIPLIGG